MVLSTILAVEGSRSVRPHWGPRPPGGIGGFSGPLGPRTAGNSGANNNRNSSRGISANPITATSSGPSAALGGVGPATVSGATSVPSVNMARRFEPAAGLPLQTDIIGPCPSGPSVGTSGPFLRRPYYPPSNVPWARAGTAEGRRTDWRKYAWLCGACGITMATLGIMYFVVYFVIRNQTSSMQYFETIPTYVPACLLTATGLLITCFMRKTNRTAIMTKLAGVSCMTCAVVCVVVTITTTVVHMNRLQTLRECVYTPQVRACACFSAVVDPSVGPGGSSAPGGTGTSNNGPLAEAGKFVFGATESCDVVHGFLYTCLRVVFGVSVVAIILCIFSCMLTYQLVSHEKKKVYWEQLELRRRSFFSSRSHPSFLYCGCHDEYGFPTADPYGWCSCSHTARLLESTSDMRTLTSPGDIALPHPRTADGLNASLRNTTDNRSRQGGQTEDTGEGNVSNGWRFLPWKRKRQQQGGVQQRSGCSSGTANGWQSANASRQSQSEVGTGSMTAAESMQLTEESSLGGPSLGNSSRSLRYSFLSNSSFDPVPRSRRGMVGSASFHVPPGLTLPAAANGRNHLLAPGVLAHQHDPLCQYPFLPSYHHHHQDPSHMANWGPPPPYSNPDSLGSGQSDSPSETSPALGPSRQQVQGASGEDRQPQQPTRNNRRNKERDQQGKKPRPTSYPASATVRGLVYNNLPHPLPVHARSTRRTVLTPASSSNGAEGQQGVRKYYGIDLEPARRAGDNRRNNNVHAERQLQQEQSTSSLSSMASARAQNLSSSGDLNANGSDTTPGDHCSHTARFLLRDLSYDPLETSLEGDPRTSGDGANSPTLTATDAEVASFFADLPDVEQAHSSPKLHKSWPNVNASKGFSLPKSASCDKPGSHQLETFGSRSLQEDAVKYKAQRSLSLKTFSNGQQKLGVWRTTGRGAGSLPHSKSIRNSQAIMSHMEYNGTALQLMKQPAINHQAILSCDNLPLVVPSQLSAQKDSTMSYSHPAIPASLAHSPLRAPSQAFQFRSIHV